MRPRNKTQRGSAIVEFALVGVTVMALFAGTFQFGYAFFMYNHLTSGVRAGARYAAALPYDPARPGEFTEAVQNMVVYGDPKAPEGTPSMVRGLNPGHVDVAVTLNGSVPDTVTVRIVNYQVDAVFGTFTYNRKPSSTFRYNGS